MNNFIKSFIRLLINTILFFIIYIILLASMESGNTYTIYENSKLNPNKDIQSQIENIVKYKIGSIPYNYTINETPQIYRFYKPKVIANFLDPNTGYAIGVDVFYNCDENIIEKIVVSEGESRFW